MQKWLDKYLIVKKEDSDDLERQAALNQYSSGMQKSHAEQSAYQRYKKIQHAMAAGYHLDSLDDAKNIVKDPKMADKHWAMYFLHMKELGSNPFTGVPSEVSTFRNDDRIPNHVFKPHPADILVLSKNC